MRTLRLVMLALVTVCRPLTAHAQAIEALWYSTDAEASVQSFLANAERISIVAPQSFSMDSAGIIWGRVDPRVIAKARETKVKLVPLIVNPGSIRGSSTTC